MPTNDMTPVITEPYEIFNDMEKWEDGDSVMAQSLPSFTQKTLYLIHGERPGLIEASLKNILDRYAK